MKDAALVKLFVLWITTMQWDWISQTLLKVVWKLIQVSTVFTESCQSFG